MKAVPIQTVRDKIYLIRGRKVMFDFDLALLYGVETKVLIQAIKRNLRRFPSEFMFQLSKKEYENLRSQIVTSRWGGRRYLPFVFTEHGVVMLSNVLRSNRAIEVSVGIIRIFIKLREAIMLNKNLADKIGGLENKVGDHDKKFIKVFDVIEEFSKHRIDPKNVDDFIG